MEKDLPTSKGKKKSIRRLTYFLDGAGKWRYIAIRDWLTQLTLRPFHIWLAGYLKLLAPDATFDQKKVHQWSKEINAVGKPIYSLDATAMTDRLPILLQCLLLAYITKKLAMVVAWGLIIVWYPFDLKGKKVYYATGQGMGTYSS